MVFPDWAPRELAEVIDDLLTQKITPPVSLLKRLLTYPPMKEVWDFVRENPSVNTGRTLGAVSFFSEVCTDFGMAEKEDPKELTFQLKDIMELTRKLRHKIDSLGDLGAMLSYNFQDLPSGHLTTMEFFEDLEARVKNALDRQDATYPYKDRPKEALFIRYLGDYFKRKFGDYHETLLTYLAQAAFEDHDQRIDVEFVKQQFQSPLG